jgi:cytidine deaminase
MALKREELKISFQHGRLSDLPKEDQALVKEAMEIRRKAYAPYSHYLVGAALRTGKNNVFTGCNIESADYTLTSHAEMVAVDAAIRAGEKKFSVIAIVGEGCATPCGLCRQKLSEFSKNMRIICASPQGEVVVSDLASLLPLRFSSDFLPHTRG